MLYQPNTRILVPGSWWRTWPRRSRRAGSGRRHVGSWFVAMMMMMKMRGLVHCLLFLYLGGTLLFRGSRQRLSGVGGALPYLVTRSRADFWRMTASASLKARGTHSDDHGEVRQQPRQNLHTCNHPSPPLPPPPPSPPPPPGHSDRPTISSPRPTRSAT